MGPSAGAISRALNTGRLRCRSHGLMVVPGEEAFDAIWPDDTDLLDKVPMLRISRVEEMRSHDHPIFHRPVSRRTPFLLAIIQPDPVEVDQRRVACGHPVPFEDPPRFGLELTERCPRPGPAQRLPHGITAGPDDLRLKTTRLVIDDPGLPPIPVVVVQTPVA